MFKVDYNPDVLTCLANLSNDEVFTPPNIVNQMLDLLPKELWVNKETTFLDPFTKSGVFLREIAKRLNVGLKEQIPDQEVRINHILTNQIFGIAITELTGLLARRSLYCSKNANGKYSISNQFDNEQGNILFERIEHTWESGKCIYCGASKDVYARNSDLETHAYLFIHKNNIEDIFKMKFDVIIGNPPYQLSDGGGRDSGAISLYNRFIEQAKKLEPNYISMIIPARWYSGGKGLDSFRDDMLNDTRIEELHDFPETSDCFPGLNIRGGICYFLWNKKYNGDCKVINYKKAKPISIMTRPLLEKESNLFIRYNEAISILNKVQSKSEPTLGNIVSARKPFGLVSNFKDFKKVSIGEYNIHLHRFGDDGYISKKEIIKNIDLVDKTKVIVSKASPGGDTYPHQILTKPIIAQKNSACTETYLIIQTVEDEQQARNLVSYVSTKFFRFLISLIKNTQNISRGVFSYVPVQDYNESWSDEKLYDKYGITKEEQEFIDSLIKPMDI